MILGKSLSSIHFDVEIPIEKGSYKNISLSQGKPDNATASPSNILEKMQMFQNENGDIETCVLDFNRQK